MLFCLCLFAVNLSASSQTDSEKLDRKLGIEATILCSKTKVELGATIVYYVYGALLCCFTPASQSVLISTCLCGIGSVYAARICCNCIKLKKAQADQRKLLHLVGASKSAAECQPPVDYKGRGVFLI